MSKLIRAASVFIALSASSSIARAQAIGAGQLSQLPPPPIADHAVPDIRIDRKRPHDNSAPAGPSFAVQVVHISGATRFPESRLLEVAAFRPGQTSLGDLRRMAERITDFYNREGFFVAQAYVPAQDIQSGVVNIVVVEGDYGKISLDNRARLSPRVANDILAGLKTGAPVLSAPLQRRLLLLSDLPGVRVGSTLSPGSTPGASDLTVHLTRGPAVDGDLEVDNAGDRYTGAYRGGGTINLNEPLGIGDVASVRVLTSGEGLQYIRGSYQAQVGDGTLGVAYAAFHYKLGEEFASLRADGTEQIASVYGSYPLIRSYDNNLRLVADADYRTFTDKIGFTSTTTDRRAEVGTIGLTGDHRDTFGGGGSDSYAVFGTIGSLDIRTPAALTIDAATARSNGGYEKLNLSLDRLQTLWGPFSLYASARGQLASKNLDISEKMELGGAYGVRAYPEGETYGDEGYIATVEARARLPRVFDAMRGRLELIGFFDTGGVRFSKTPWFPGIDTAVRSGAGVGLNWIDNRDFVVRVSYAFKLTGPSTSAPDRSGQFWFQVVKFF